MSKRMKASYFKKRVFAVLLIVVLVVAGIPVSAVRVQAADAVSGIKGNGTGGIYIDINASPFTDYKNRPWGSVAYTNGGCTWYVAARVKQLTGKDVAINGGNTWYDSGNDTGYERGQELKAPAVLCWNGHVAILEKIDGNTAYISEGGAWDSDAAHGYCIIRSCSLDNAKKCPGGKTFRGLVYLPGSSNGSYSAEQIKAVMFVAKYYADSYGDLKVAFGYNEAQLYNHYIQFGIREGRSASPIFDPVFYLDNNEDLKNAFGNDYIQAYNHWIRHGCGEGRNSSKYYNGSYYRNKYSDLQNAFFQGGSDVNNYYNLAVHYLNYGIKERRLANSNGYFPTWDIAAVSAEREKNTENVNFENYSVNGVTKNNAIPRCSISYSGARLSSVGIYVGTSVQNMKKVASDKINHNKNPFDVWYNLRTEGKMTLKKNTKYYFKFYAIVNGAEYGSEIKYFVTKK